STMTTNGVMLGTEPLWPQARNRGQYASDPNGNMWIFSGTNNIGGGGPINDLWKFSIETESWVLLTQPVDFQKGDMGYYTGNPVLVRPAARYSGKLHYDSRGKLWLTGGWAGTNSNVKDPNDVWCYDLETNLWTLKSPMDS